MDYQDRIKFRSLLDELISIMEEEQANLADVKKAIVLLAQAIKKIS